MSRLTISPPALAGALDDRVDLGLRRPAHFDEIRQRNASHRRIANRGNHLVAVAAKHEGGHVFNRDLQFISEKIAKARRIEHAGHADDLLARQTAELLQRPHHGVERVGDADDEGLRGMRLDPRRHRVHDLEVDAEQVVAAHAGLAGDACGDDDDVGAGDRGIVARAGQSRVDALNRGRFGQIQRLALRHAINDVEKDDVAELLQRRQESQRSANLPGSDQSYLLARHRILSSALRDRQARLRGGRFAGCYRPIDARDQAKLLAEEPKKARRPTQGKSNPCIFSKTQASTQRKPRQMGSIPRSLRRLEDRGRQQRTGATGLTGNLLSLRRERGFRLGLRSFKRLPRFSVEVHIAFLTKRDPFRCQKSFLRNEKWRPFLRQIYRQP